jgi:hypothetical protein
LFWCDRDYRRQLQSVLASDSPQLVASLDITLVLVFVHLKSAVKLAKSRTPSFEITEVSVKVSFVQKVEKIVSNFAHLQDLPKLLDITFER